MLVLILRCSTIDPTRASITLAKLQNTIKASFDATNDSLKETHSSLNKYTKALDKVNWKSMAEGAKNWLRAARSSQLWVLIRNAFDVKHLITEYTSNTKS